MNLISNTSTKFHLNLSHSNWELSRKSGTHTHIHTHTHTRTPTHTHMSNIANHFWIDVKSNLIITHAHTNKRCKESQSCYDEKVLWKRKSSILTNARHILLTLQWIVCSSQANLGIWLYWLILTTRSIYIMLWVCDFLPRPVTLNKG